MAILRDAAEDGGLFTDGDWILSENMSKEGTIGVIQLKHVGVGEFVQKDFQFISKETFQELGCTEVLPGDILISRMADPIGRACVVPSLPFRTVTAVDVSILRVNQRIDSRFVMHLCNSSVVRKQIDFASRGTTRSRITRTELEGIKIPLPELADQQQIAHLLDKVDRLRRTRSYELALTGSLLRADFLQLFGDPAINPRQFPMETVGSVFSRQRDGAKCGPFGSALKKHEYTPRGVPVWTMENVGENEFRADGCLYITPQKFEELRAYDVQNGDILISRAGTVGRMAIVDTKHPRSIIHSNIIRLSLDTSRCLPIYFTVLMTYFADRVGRLKRGQEDAYTFMNTGRLAELRIPVPALPMQQQFAKVVARHERLRAVQRESLRQAGHLFQTLLHRAFAEQL